MVDGVLIHIFQRSLRLSKDGLLLGAALCLFVLHTYAHKVMHECTQL